MTDISVIIPCRNEEATIQQLLISLINQTIPHQSIEIIIADGMSTDGTLQKISEFQTNYPSVNVSIVKNPKRNIPAGLNCAINASKGIYIIRLDAHSIPASDYIERCVKLLQENVAENVGGIWNIKPSNDKDVSAAIAIAAAHPLGVGGANYRNKDAQAGYVDTVPFGAFNRNFLNKVGLFDETLLSNEDYELNARIRKAGGRIYLDPSIQCVYFARENLTQLSKQYWRYGFWKFKMLQRYPKTIRGRQALPPLFILSLFLLFVVGLFYPVFFVALLAEIFLYIATLFIGTSSSFRQNKGSVKLWLLIVLSIMTMHFSWGSAFLYSLLDSVFKR